MLYDAMMHHRYDLLALSIGLSHLTLDPLDALLIETASRRGVVIGDIVIVLTSIDADDA